MAVSWFVIIQSVIGILQFAACGDPDAVCGTFGLLDFLGGITIAQVYLTFNLFAMIMFLMTDTRTRLENAADRRRSLGLPAGTLRTPDAVLHRLAGDRRHAAIAVAGHAQARRGVVAVLVVLMASVSSIDRHDIDEWYRKVALEKDSPKKMVTDLGGEPDVGTEEPAAGHGDGAIRQSCGADLVRRVFVDGAAQVADGRVPLLSRSVLAAVVRISGPRRGKCDQSAVLFGDEFDRRAGAAAGFGFVLRARFTTSTATGGLLARPDSHARSVGMWANVGLVFFVACCFIENYIEFPQAIFLPALLYFAALSTTKTERFHASPAAERGRRVVAGGHDD